MTTLHECIEFGAHQLALEDIVALSDRRCTSVFATDQAFVDSVNKGTDLLDRELREHRRIQGAN